MKDFKLNGKEFIELHDLLKVMGFCDSGGMAKIVISEGQVKVDGTVEIKKRCKIRTGQLVEFDGREIKIQ